MKIKLMNKQFKNIKDKLTFINLIEFLENSFYECYQNINKRLKKSKEFIESIKNFIKEDYNQINLHEFKGIANEIITTYESVSNFISKIEQKTLKKI